MEVVIRGTGEWATLDTGVAGPRNATQLADAGLRHGASVHVRDGVVIAVGEPDEWPRALPHLPLIDLGDLLVTPGFVDPHTHPVFAATREDEFELRCRGVSYEEIARRGGGIRNSARKLRNVPPKQMLAAVLERADSFLLHGTTTIEAKSGYGLSLESELASLRAIRDAQSAHALDFVPTFLGAHEIPDEYRSDREGYIRLLIDEMLPQIAREGLAEACDVFCEAHVFSVEEARRILLAARALGLQLKLHADEIRPIGGAGLAAELHALSADHLVVASQRDLEAMRDAGVVAVLLPATSLFLNLPQDAPGRSMLELGLAPALATDFNPGSSPTRNMSLVLSLACIKYGMSAAQALGAATWNAAHAIGRGGRIGAIAPGFFADITAFNLANLASLPYHFGENRVDTVIKRGVPVVRAAHLLPTARNSPC
ncbi:MAG: imidazolonepropionase [Planctomycetes bacterium]|nr:imidazolonepropionase [Planctomycetota bacterium]